jgi:hypothetical protein
MTSKIVSLEDLDQFLDGDDPTVILIVQIKAESQLIRVVSERCVLYQA